MTDELPMEMIKSLLQEKSGVQAFVLVDQKKAGQALKSNLKIKYGLSGSDYVEMYKKQNGVCYFCRKKNGKKRLAVDHDHVTGRVRGLLCDGCNINLGVIENWLREKSSLSELIHYLGLDNSSGV